MLKPALGLIFTTLFLAACAKQSTSADLPDQDASASPKLEIANYIVAKNKQNKPFLFLSVSELKVLKKKQDHLIKTLTGPKVPHSFAIFKMWKDVEEDASEVQGVIDAKEKAQKDGAAVTVTSLKSKSDELIADYNNKAAALSAMGTPISTWSQAKLQAVLDITKQAVIDAEIISALPPTKAHKDVKSSVKSLVERYKDAQKALGLRTPEKPEEREI